MLFFSYGGSCIAVEGIFIILIIEEIIYFLKLSLNRGEVLARQKDGRERAQTIQWILIGLVELFKWRDTQNINYKRI